MFAACGRRRGASLVLAGLPRAEAAAGHLLGDPRLSGAPESVTACSGWPSSSSVYAAAAAGAVPVGKAAWGAHWQCAHTFTSAAALQLSAVHPEREQSSSADEQQYNSQAATAASSSGGGGGGSSSGSATPQQPQQPATGTWLDRLPRSWLPYAQLMRLEKPIGTWLLAWPCFWSIAIAAPPGTPPDLRLLALFGAGAVLLRGAGCTVNDLWDRDLDKQVERTRGRPLAAGAVTPAQAIAFLGAQLAAGLAILVQLNPYSQLLGASSLALVATYPLMKRITGWPQAFLGLTLNWGALLGWAAVHGSCDWGVVLPLYASGVCWTLVYDTIYAHQDKADDVKAGIRSTALTFGARSKLYLSGFAAANLALLALTGQAAGCGAAYYAGLAAAGGHLAWQIGSVDLEDRADCQAKFVSNTSYGALLFAGILADRLMLLS